MAYYRLKRTGQKHILSMSIAALVLVVVVAPWFVRNHLVFKQFIPFRNNFWMEVYQGNTGDTSDVVPAWTRPSENSEEMARFRQMGEINYIEDKRRQAIDFIAVHPITFLWLSSRRVMYTWTGFWSFSASYLALEPFEIPNILFL